MIIRLYEEKNPSNSVLSFIMILSIDFKDISKGKSIDFKATYLWFDPLVRGDFNYLFIIFQFFVSSSVFWGLLCQITYSIRICRNLG